jgi:hypothetical protein
MQHERKKLQKSSHSRSRTVNLCASSSHKQRISAHRLTSPAAQCTLRAAATAGSGRRHNMVSSSARLPPFLACPAVVGRGARPGCRPRVGRRGQCPLALGLAGLPGGIASVSDQQCSATSWNHGAWIQQSSSPRTTDAAVTTQWACVMIHDMLVQLVGSCHQLFYGILSAPLLQHTCRSIS